MAHEIVHQKHKDMYRILHFLGFFLLHVFFLIDIGFQAVIDRFADYSESDLQTMHYMIFGLPSKFGVIFNYSRPPILERIRYAKDEIEST